MASRCVYSRVAATLRRGANTMGPAADALLSGLADGTPLAHVAGLPPMPARELCLRAGWPLQRTARHLMHTGLRDLARSHPSIIARVSPRLFAVLSLARMPRPEPGAAMTRAQWQAEAARCKGVGRIAAVMMACPRAAGGARTPAEMARQLLDALWASFCGRAALKPAEQRVIVRLARQVGFTDDKGPNRDTRTKTASAIRTMLSPSPRRRAAPLLTLEDGVIVPTWRRDAHPVHVLGAREPRPWQLARDVLAGRASRVRARTLPALRADLRGELVRDEHQRLAARLRPHQGLRGDGTPSRKLALRLRRSGVPAVELFSRAEAVAVHRALHAREVDRENKLQLNEILKLGELLGPHAATAASWTPAEFSAALRPCFDPPGEGWSEAEIDHGPDAALLAEADAVFTE